MKGPFRYFFRSLFLFAVCALIVLLAADFVYSLCLRRVKEGNNEIWLDVMTGKVETENAILGDSRVNTDCIPSVIDSITGLSVYDLGVMGNHFSIQRLRYDMYKEHNPKPRIMVQFEDNWLFEGAYGFDMKQFLPWMWNRQFLTEALALEPVFFAPYVFPWFRYRGCHPTGYHWLRRQTDKGFFTYPSEDPVKTIERHKLKFAENPRREKLFREYVSDLSKEGIKTVFVVAPFFSPSSLPREALEYNSSRLAEIAQEEGVPILDYTWSSFAEDPDMFIDSIHLNRKGAEVFSGILARDLKKLLRL